MCENNHNLSFYEKVSPIKLTEARKCKLNAESWSILSDYFLESVKMSKPKLGVVESVAIIRIGDKSGHVTCVLKGPITGLLFGLSPKEWTEVENLCNPGQQIFYRYFKHGLNNTFAFEQKIFYNFCMTNQRNDVLVAKFQRCINVRNKFKNEALLKILDLKKCSAALLDLYIVELRKQSKDKNSSNILKVIS